MFRHPVADRAFVKFGITHHGNVEDRFNPLVEDGYEKNYEDWEIRCLFSQLVPTKDHALQMEHHMLHEMFPPRQYKVWVERYLGCPDNNYYDRCSGITELRVVSIRQMKWAIAQLYAQRNNK